jgi:hypothetical protein
MKSAAQREHEKLWSEMCQCWHEISKLRAQRRRVDTMWTRFQIEAERGLRRTASLDKKIAELWDREAVLSRAFRQNPWTIELVAKIQAIGIHRQRSKNKLKMSA